MSKGLMYQAARALSELLDRDDIDSGKVTVIICADDPEISAKIERAIAREVDALMLTFQAQPKSIGVGSFKLHGIRIVLSDLSHEEPMYLITKDAPR